MFYIWNFGRSLARRIHYGRWSVAGPLADLNDHILRDIGMFAFEERHEAAPSPAPQPKWQTDQT